MKPLPLPKQKNLRADCAWVIYQILEQGKSSRDCLERVQRRHNVRDNAWLQEMSLGVMRKLPLLQHWLRTLLDRPLKGNKKVLEHLIMLGLYQLAFSRVSKHAAVGETVAAASYLGGTGLKGLVNAVLRNFQREDLASRPVEDPIINSGLPKWLFKAIESAYNDDANAVRQATNDMAPIWLRVNSRQIHKDDFASLLTKANVEFSFSNEHENGIVLKSREDITALPGFDKGFFAVQDGAAQLAAHYLNPQNGERVLDCCAAPGGKTGHIAELAPKLAYCLALDADEKRLQRVHENMDRLKHSVEIKQGDATNPSQWWDGELFDRILLDAPCSATGVIRRHPDIRWLRKSSDIDNLAALQREILSALWKLLKPGGTLLYATCSILPKENKAQVARFIAETEDANLQPIIKTETNENPGRQILPGEQQMDGFYYARLVKSSCAIR
ncbi:MAG: 16S rRNA (cytosine(967)-C(5))-methyltransferase RsmB [Alteromonas sp.]|uniref:16S rRNA (cytosine(967)-C(5))-methyltransferase RsmB n=1 Tax=unclassified Alteromonas TaxID=2614992 RepID=UPI0009037306|nr:MULTISPECIES: 16S rRNA (cytosine(967)-C(5))-methyltransferase RsmB [unclassified Alteromonas]APE04377.1 16S rRNA (cytosine(967)-C(5))-methyltransferase [Alteromonas sp. RW2A1]AUC86782.1 16S rRNA (cytosine(967)-C(5))-methyltransferase RsmB [Alteromonas sp. MB-3u-76]MAI64054.1 16S rRNA (cytosine(967)-C(5))-methyltransferase RsmB [Alteromonas sp.]